VEQAEPAPVSSHAEPGDGANAQPPEPAPVSSHAEPGDGANAQPPEPAPVSSHAEPGDGGANAQPPSNWAGGETALRYVSIAGIVLIPLVLAAGWMAKFARRSHGSALPERLRAMLQRLRPRRRRKALDAAAFDEAEFDETAHDQATFDAADEDARRKAAFVGAAPGGSARPGRRASADRRARVVTDPAHDLKKSLTELMYDLRRAAEPQPPARYAQRSYGRAGERVSSPSLQPAE
jgi:hypothetical protein